MVSGSLNSTASTAFRIELFSSPTGDTSGHGEGQTYLGAIPVITDASGNAAFSTTLTGVSVAAGHVVTATATVDLGGGNYGSTSEFAANLLANGTAQVVAGQDTYIKLANTGLNYGAATSLVIDRESGDLQRALLQFNLSAIPASATITSATLTMQSTQIGGALNISIYEMLRAWAEGGGNATADAANWNESTPGTNWTSAGGDFNATPVANLNTNATGQHAWDLTALVQAWVNGSEVNNGVMVASPDGGGNRTVTYDSSEGATPPQLVINYTVPANVAPTLDASRSPALGSVAEDAGAPVGAVGTLVSALVDFASPSGQVDNVTDPDSGALLGIAITAADTANGVWWYSTNGGTSWNALGAVANNNARLLAADAGTRLYFQGNANWNGTLANAITFRAWDQTSGANGALADTFVNGGAAAFSTAADTAGLVVTAVNDAPGVALPASQNTAINTSLVLSTGNGNAITVSDVDAGAALLRVTLLGTNGSSTLASTTGLTLLTGNGTSNVVFQGSLVNINNALNGLIFTPNTNFSGGAQLQVAVDDQGNTGSGGAKLTNPTLFISVIYTPPNLTTTGGSLAYVENAAATPVDPGLTLVPGNVNPLTGAQARVSANYAIGEDTLTYNAGAAAGGRRWQTGALDRGRWSLPATRPPPPTKRCSGPSATTTAATLPAPRRAPSRSP